MTKKILNQNANYTLEIIRSVEEEFTLKKTHQQISDN